MSGSVDTFIGCLMSGLSEAQYAEGRSHLLAIDAALKDKLGATKNHCEGIMVASTSSFGTPKESLAMDVEAIRAADRCVFYLYDGQPRPSGMWVEAGVAIGLKKPCTFLVPSKDALPPSLRSEELPKGVKVVVYQDHAALLEGLKSTPSTLLGEAAEAERIQATLVELRDTLPATQVVAASAAGLDSLCALASTLKERFEAAAEKADAVDKHRVEGIRIDDKPLFVPAVTDVAKHLLGLVADPHSAPISRNVNGTWMIASHGQALDSVMDAWTAAQNTPEKRSMSEAQARYAHVHGIWMEEREILLALAAALEPRRHGR
jgi:nucleoside 2-deoxyribosyltransferase